MQLTFTEKLRKPKGLELVYYKKSLVLGVGCERGCSSEELIELAEKTLAKDGYASEAVGLVASIDLKTDEAAIHALANQVRFQTQQIGRPNTAHRYKENVVDQNDVQVTCNS